MNTANDLRFFMDETSAPYEEKDNRFFRTKEDDEFDEMIIAKYNLVTKEMENRNADKKDSDCCNINMGRNNDNK